MWFGNGYLSPLYACPRRRVGVAMIENWANCPLPIIPKEQRLKTKTLAPCKGPCNSMKPIWNNKYQLCSTCSKKYRNYGGECDVPNCKTVCDGVIAFTKTPENKLLCISCERSWRGTFNSCVWERFVEERHLHLLRPATFVKVAEDGLLREIPKHLRVKQKDVAECQFCYKYESIDNMKYQLCSGCRYELQYLGEKCSIKGAEPCPCYGRVIFDTNESRFVCGACSATKKNHNIASYRIYETQVRTKTKCDICATSISHNKKEGETHCSAKIDHDHDTGEVRGVLCHNCNAAEGLVKKTPVSLLSWAKNLVYYLENPPLSKSWMQE